MENNQEMPRINWNYLFLTDHERFIYDMATLGREKTKEEKRIQLVTELLWHPFGFVKSGFRTLRRKTRNYVRDHISSRVNKFLFTIAPKKYCVSKLYDGNYITTPFAIVPFTGGIRKLSNSEGNGYVRYKNMKYTMACYRLKTAKEAMEFIVKENNDKIQAETQEKLNQLLSSGGIQNKEEV